MYVCAFCPVYVCAVLHIMCVCANIAQCLVFVVLEECMVVHLCVYVCSLTLNVNVSFWSGSLYSAGVKFLVVTDKRQIRRGVWVWVCGW